MASKIRFPFPCTKPKTPTPLLSIIVCRKSSWSCPDTYQISHIIRPNAFECPVKPFLTIARLHTLFAGDFWNSFPEVKLKSRSKASISVIESLLRRGPINSLFYDKTIQTISTFAFVPAKTLDSKLDSVLRSRNFV